MTRLALLGFDADDTLWQNEQFFRLNETRFAEMLGAHGEHDAITARLLDAERRNLEFYGYGIKGFTLSLIETAIEVTQGRVEASVIHDILEMGREMLRHPVEALPGAREALEALSESHRLVLVTKGDLFDQERKLAASGLGDFFAGVEIVSDKRADTYARIFARHGEGAERGLMVGNSLKSDVLPMIAAGGWGVHVPHPLTWVLEHAEAPEDHPRFRVIEGLAELPALVAAIEGEGLPVDPTLG
ncbi:MAG: HAD family hydrolase [Mesorhizobium amorphae]|nr:MAG: HAD family hydrolase [Mesorhizobium amorphae]